MNFLRSLRRTSAAAAFASLALAATASAGLANPLAGMNGSWSGAGQFRLENGKTESIRCTAHYAPKGGSALGLALRCASASSRVDLRANLATSGSRVSGTWEERSYNASGNVSGVAAGNNLRLSISGGGLSGFMVVTTTGGSQSISVRTDGSALLGVNISLRRN
jgi:hypothetical protein